jgi:hypothetical protein
MWTRAIRPKSIDADFQRDEGWIFVLEVERAQ